MMKGAEGVRCVERGVGRAVSVGVGMVAAMLFGLAAPAAQNLPSADDLEAEEPSQQQDEEGTSETASSSSESSESSGSKDSESTGSEGSGVESTGPEGSGAESTASEEAGAESEGSSDESRSQGATEETAKEGGEHEGAEEDEPGKIVDTETTVEREVEGRGSPEGDRRYVQSGLNSHGVPGFQHITSAKARYPNTYNVGFFGAVSGGKNMLRAGDRNTFAAGRLTLHGQFIEHFSANLGLEASNNVNSIAQPQAMLSQGDLSAGLRGHYAAREFLHVGGDVSFLFPTGFSAAGVDFAGTTVTPRLLTTLEANPLVEGADVPLAAHLNVGYRFDNTSNTVPRGLELTRVERFAHDISAYDYVQLGLGVDYDVPYVSPFAAWNFEIPVAGPSGICGDLQSLECVDANGLAAYPNTISLGVRGEPVEQLALHGGVDLSLTGRQAAGIPATVPYKVVLGASWNVDPRAKVERVTKTIEKTRQVGGGPGGGYIDGTVVDKETGEPIGGAQIEYLEMDRSPQMTGSENGAFRSYRFEPGSELTVRISHPDYHSREITGTIQKDPEPTNFELKPKPKSATVSGTVADASGNPVSGATVRFGGGPETREVTTGASGEFEVELKAGSYDVGTTSPNHLAAKDSIDVEAGGSATLSFSLEKGGDPSLVEVDGEKVTIQQRISFASGTANISSDSYATLDQVASTLVAHPEIERVEVQGHTDDVGAKEANMKLSEKRAKAVRDYLVDQGVNEGRLVAEGYGPTKPKVPNISDRNRRLNRRVEFKIME